MHWKQFTTKKDAQMWRFLIQQFQVAIRTTSPDMTTICHAWPYGRFIAIQSNLRRKKLQKTNQGSNFLGSSFSNRENIRAPIQFRRESQTQQTTDPSILTTIAPALLDWSNKISWVFPTMRSTSHFLPQSTVSRRSDSSSEANTSCCQRSDALSHLEQGVVSSA